MGLILTGSSVLCGHFHTDVAYLPELRSHLDRLLADHERVIAATELEPWARTEAAPSDTEIDKARALIRRLDDHIDDQSRIVPLRRSTAQRLVD